MIRLILYGLLFFIAYRVISSLMRGGVEKMVKGAKNAEVDSMMVKDPFCEVYFPKKDGVKAVVEGEERYFCSPECRDRFIKQQQKSPDNGKPQGE